MAPRFTLPPAVLATKRPRWNWYFQSPWIDFKVIQGEEVDHSLFHSHPEELMWWSWALKRRGVTQMLWLMLDANCGPQAQSPAECWFPTFTEGPQSRLGMEEFTCHFWRFLRKGWDAKEVRGFVGSLKRSFESALVLTANSQVQDGAPHH